MIAAILPTAVAPNANPDVRFPYVGVSYTGDKTKSWNPSGVVSCVAVGPHWLLASGHGGVGDVVSFDPDGTHAPSKGIRIDASRVIRFSQTDLMLVHTLDPMTHFVRVSSEAPVVGFIAHEEADGPAKRSVRFRTTGNIPDNLTWVGYGPTGAIKQDRTGYEIAWKTKGIRHAAAGRADFSGILTGAKNEEYSIFGSMLLHDGDPMINGGDSGGAVLVDRNGTYELVGIISFRQGVGSDFADSHGLKASSVAADATILAGQIANLNKQKDKQ